MSSRSEFSLDGYVYFVRLGDKMKIGFSTRIPRRFVELSRDEGSPCRVLACVPGTTRLERELHEWFTSWSLNGGRGDWFSAAPELIAFAQTLGGKFVGQSFEPEPAAQQTGWWHHNLLAFMSQRGLTQKDVATALGMAQSKVHYWMQGSTPRGRTRAHIEAWSDGAIPATNVNEVAAKAS